MEFFIITIHFFKLVNILQDGLDGHALCRYLLKNLLLHKMKISKINMQIWNTKNKVQNEGTLLNKDKKMRILTMMDMKWNHISD
jgi:hypothetical protein